MTVRKPGDQWKPANGTDGMDFMERWCWCCKHEETCPALTAAGLGEQPREWIVGLDGNPCCRKFEAGEERGL